MVRRIRLKQVGIGLKGHAHAVEIEGGVPRAAATSSGAAAVRQPEPTNAR